VGRPFIPRIGAACRACGAHFLITQLWARTGRGIFCGRACRDAPRGPDPGKWEAATCPQCGRGFSHRTSSPQVCCSFACRARYRPKPRTAYEVECGFCGRVLTTIPSEAQRYCSLQCRSRARAARGDHLRGPAHPLWRGGGKPSYGPSWPAARRAAIERDAVCLRCGAAAQAGRPGLHVHHISPFRTFGPERLAEANALANLRTLCGPCHTIEEWAMTPRRHALHRD
jgi:5-methylcytosine-specific restriction endonuclease McrA